MHDRVVVERDQATFRCEVESLPGELPPSQPLWKINGVDLNRGCKTNQLLEKKLSFGLKMPHTDIKAFKIFLQYINFHAAHIFDLIKKHLKFKIRSIKKPLLKNNNACSKQNVKNGYLN